YVGVEGSEAAMRLALQLDADTLAHLVGNGTNGLTLAFPSRQVAELQALSDAALPLLATLLTVAEADTLAAELAPGALADTSFASCLPEVDRPLAQNRQGADEEEEANAGMVGAIAATGEQEAAVARLVLGVEEGYQRAYREAEARGFGEKPTRAEQALSL